MASRITDNIRNLAARSFYNYLKGSGTDHTYYIGLSFYNDSDFMTHSNSAESDAGFIGGTEGYDSDIYDIGDFEFFLKNTTTIHKIFSGGVSRVVPRIDWTSGETYEGWSTKATKHYVIVNEFYNGVSKLNVYKCLYSPGKPSTEIPQGQLPLPTQTADGYTWLYMYTISNSEALRFLTNKWMPVPEKVTNSEVANLQQGTNKYYQYIQQTSSINGTIYNVEIDSEAAVAQFPALKSGLVKTVFANNTDFFVKDSDQYQSQIIWDSENDKLYQRLISAGSGYSSNVAFVDDSERPITWLTPYVAPGKGHGSDAPTELGAKYLMVSSRVTPSEKLLYVMNSTFKTVNLIQNPIDKGTNNIAQNDYYFACRNFETENENEYVIGDVIRSRFNDDGRRLRVVGKNGKFIYYTDITPASVGLSGTLLDSELITDISQTKNSKVKANFDREVYYTFDELVLVDILDNTIQRQDDQIESINLIFRF